MQLSDRSYDLDSAASEWPGNYYTNVSKCIGVSVLYDLQYGLATSSCAHLQAAFRAGQLLDLS